MNLFPGQAARVVFGQMAVQPLRGAAAAENEGEKTGFSHGLIDQVCDRGRGRGAHFLDGGEDQKVRRLSVSHRAPGCAEADRAAR